MRTPHQDGPGPKANPADLASHLTLILGDSCYSVEVLDPEAPEVARLVRLRTLAGGEVYDVASTRDGLVTCTCGDYEFRRKGTADRCKHGAALVKARLIDAPGPRPDLVNGHADRRAVARSIVLEEGPASAPCRAPEAAPCVPCRADAGPGPHPADAYRGQHAFPPASAAGDAPAEAGDVDLVGPEARAWWAGYRAAAEDLSRRPTPRVSGLTDRDVNRRGRIG